MCRSLHMCVAVSPGSYRRELVRVGKQTPLETMLGGKRSAELLDWREWSAAALLGDGGNASGAAAAVASVANMMVGDNGVEAAAVLQNLEVALSPESSYGKQQLGAHGASTAPLAILPSALGLGGIIVN